YHTQTDRSHDGDPVGDPLQQAGNPRGVPQRSLCRSGRPARRSRFRAGESIFLQPAVVGAQASSGGAVGRSREGAFLLQPASQSRSGAGAPFDPILQMKSEAAVRESFAKMAGRKGSDEMETAMVVTNPETGEVQALIGSRQAGFAGFNRALDAVRQGRGWPDLEAAELRSQGPRQHLPVSGPGA
nr:hypothetical protein [Tanacetum cinerariifolium]